MAQRVGYPDHIAPLVEFVEDTTPERIVAATHDKLATGTTVKDMLLASALAVVRSSDLPPGHHGGPLHPLCGLHAVHHISARLPGEYAMLPVIQNVAVANKHIHSPAMGPYMLADARPVSENDDVDATVKAFRAAVSRAASTTRVITTSCTCSSGSRRCRSSSSCSRSACRRTSSTTTTSCSRGSPGGRSSISAGRTRSTSAGRRGATAPDRRTRRWARRPTD